MLLGTAVYIGAVPAFFFRISQLFWMPGKFIFSYPYPEAGDLKLMGYSLFISKQM